MNPMNSDSPNPLLLRGKLPQFDKIKAEHVVGAVRSLLENLGRQLDELEKNPEPTWEGLMLPLEDMMQELQMTWGPVNHLMGVQNTTELREAHETVLPEVVQFNLRLGQSRPIYKALEHIKNSTNWDSLPESRQRIIEKDLQNARHSGIGLEGKERVRFNELTRELSSLSTKFSNNVLDSTRAYFLDLDQKEEVDGLPESLLSLASQNYNAARREADKEDTEEQSTPATGPWRITLDIPAFLPFMQHSRRRDLREKIYRAYIARASTGDLDNTPLITQILKLKKERAALLGYKSHAELSLSEKMAADVSEVETLLEELRVASWDKAIEDLDELRSIARENGFTEELKHWDMTYWAERLQEREFNFTDEDLRPYFPLEKVLGGLFSLVEKIFAIKVKSADGEAPVWHPDVRFFKIYDLSGEEMAGFYLDPYSRPGDKRGGAWMDECVVRRRTAQGLELPVAHLVCNSTPPVGAKPSLMTFGEVETLFHEFGHGLQHMLTRVDEMEASGINGVEWDAVELPSQFMENWCYHKPTLLGLTAHVDTGEPMPAELFERLLKARTFRAGSLMLRQLKFGLLDMELHHRYDPAGKETVFEVQKRIDKSTSPIPSLPEDRFLCSFGHIFAGGYSAGYYSYKWAEVMSADAFGAFEESGLDNEAAIKKTGKRFRDTVLSLGGSRHPAEVFKEFRGRGPSTEALLRHNGLLNRAG